MSYLSLFLTLILTVDPLSFKQKQQQFSRVKEAYRDKSERISDLLTAKGIGQQYEILIRAFKAEKTVEVWIKNSTSSTPFTLLTSYPFCTTSGVLGPKRKEGDLQIPEGVYHINHFNPLSNFYLSLGINYPNSSDQLLADPQKPGGSIYIHGNCVTIGCIPITDDKIKELYLLAVEARTHGQEKIPVHIFPARLSAGRPEQLATDYPQHLSFWKNLQEIFLDFEASHRLKVVTVDAKGFYRLN